MSDSDRKTVIALLTLYHIAETYSGIEAKEYLYFIDQVINVYKANEPVSVNEYDALKRKMTLIDEKVSDLHFESSITLTMAIGIMVAEHFLSFVKHPCRKEAWIQLHEFCSNNQLIKHSLRQQIFTELDKGDIITSIITGGS